MSYDDWLFREADKDAQKRYSSQGENMENISDWIEDAEMAKSYLTELRDTESLKLICPKGYESIIDAIESCIFATDELERSYEEIGRV